MTKLDYANPTLRREIGLFGAVMLGLGSILGTGVFVSLAHATELAGPWVLLAIVLAGLLAYCNAMSSAQLAAAYPVSGGTYEYGYRVLNPTLGFTAGWMFLLAKSASAATAALAVSQSLAGAYIWDWISSQMVQPNHFQATVHQPSTQIVIAFATVVVIAASVIGGMRRASVFYHLIVTITLAGIACFVLQFADEFQNFAVEAPYRWPRRSWNETLQATALIFVAFTGYGRIATLGEEVRSPRRTIPRAILISLAIAFLSYAAVGFVLYKIYPIYGVFGMRIHSLTEVNAGDIKGLKVMVRVAAVTAMLGVLLNLILGLSRVWLAMGRRGDMPRILARVNEKTSTPVPATILSGVVIALLVLVGDVRTTWSFSAFTVLIYYAITNWAALKLAPEFRRYPRALSWIGLVACLSLAWFVEVKVWIAGTILIVVGLIWHRIRSRWRGQTDGLVAPS